MSAAASSVLVERTATLSTIFPAEQVQRFANVLDADQLIRWQVLAPQGEGTRGVLVFVSPTNSGTPPDEWREILERRNLIWVAADEFGNAKPTAQRILTALLGLALLQREYSIDSTRIYIAGMSGGGRAASQAITKFPQLFTGALYIVGVDFWTSAEQRLLPQIATKRYVFLTGTDDFNRSETKKVYRQYRSAGVSQVLLLDLPHYGHQNPNAQQLEQALQFLDADR